MDNIQQAYESGMTILRMNQKEPDKVVKYNNQEFDPDKQAEDPLKKANATDNIAVNIGDQLREKYKQED